MEFRVLGPLAIRDGDTELPLQRGKQRGLLAVLLLHANELVSIDRLVDALWGESPPATAEHALEVYVSRLRRILEAWEREPRLLTRPGGYLLRVEPDELDLTRFDRLARRGRRALAADDPASAASILRAAESMWSGPPLTDLGREPFAPAAIARLEEARQAVVGDRIEAELALGQHAELIGEIEGLIAAEPLRERPHAQLMLALYRSGRQAEALRAYQDLRSTLVDDLGLEPSPELQQLEQAILRQEPALDAPARVRLQDDEPERPTAFELKLVTVLFAALADTRVASTDPERRHELQRRFLADVSAEVGPSGARVIGVADGTVMATFGTPTAQEDHVDRALRAALAIRSRANGAAGSAPGIRVGIESGEVIAGVDPADGPPIAGAAVDTAAGLAHAAAPGDILVGPRALAAVRGTFTFAGENGSTRLIDESSDARSGSGLGRTFVGREDELTVLEVAYRRAVEGAEPRTITVVGDPGVGKSTLVRRWLASVRTGTPAPVARIGRCPAYGQGITYWPLAEVLREHLGIRGSDPPERLLELLGERTILGLTMGLDTAGDLHPMAAQNRLHDAWVGLLDEVVADRPTILLVEDIHWAEPPLLDLLERIGREVDGPLVVLTTARPEIARSRPSWVATHRRSATIWLDPLSSDEADAMVAALLDGEVLPGLNDLVVDRAEGNPFFLEELIVTLTEHGVLTRDAGGWRFDQAAGPSVVPDSVRALLAARLDLLGPVDKSALQAGAVIGRRFEPEAIVELLSGVEPDFVTLRSRDFIRRASRPTDGTSGSYAFKHALTREVAYDSLPTTRRTRLHAAYAERIERDGEGRDEHAATLAHHYAEAVRPADVDLAWATEPERLASLRRKARDWSVRAAHLAVARYAIDEAVKLLERALTLEPSLEEQSAIWLSIGRANVLRYDGVGFWTAMEQAIATASSDAARAAIYAELAFETAFRWAIWKRMPSRELVDGWIGKALALAEPGTRARAVALIASADWHPLEVGDAPEEAIAIAERLDDPALLSYALDARALSAFASGDDVAAHGWWERRTGLADRIHDLDHLEDLYGAAITGNVALGMLPEARRFAHLHDEVAVQLSPHHRLHAVAMLVELAELCGEWEGLLALAERTERAVADNLATPCVRNQRSLLACALAAAELGYDDESRRLEALAEGLAMEGYEAVFDPIRARLALRRGDLEGARRLIPTTIPPPTKNYYRITTTTARLDILLALGETATVEAEAPALLVPSTLVEPFGWSALGIARDDVGLIEAAAAQFDEFGLTWQADRARAAIAAVAAHGEGVLGER